MRNFAKRLAYVLGDYPGGAQTFVINEIKTLVKRGIRVYVCPIHYVPQDPRDAAAPKQVKVIGAGPVHGAGVVLSHLFFIFSKPVVYFKFLLKPMSCGGRRVFLRSVFFAWKIKTLGLKNIHAHFAWAAADSARIISSLTNIPFSFTAHAADIYCPTNNFEEKIKEATFVLTCVKGNKAYIGRKFGDDLGKKVRVVYHGVDTDMFRPLVHATNTLDVLSIANLVEKKGHRYLIEACSALRKEGVSLRCRIVGDGPEKPRLLAMIDRLKLKEQVEIVGKYPHHMLPRIYASSKIFVLPSIIASNGDRDGIPNVLMEAMAMGLPVISTRLPNIAELIENGRDGILTMEKSVTMLAEAIGGLLADEKKCRHLGENAREKVLRQFSARDQIRTIATLLRH